MLRPRMNVALTRRAALPSPARATLKASCPACTRLYSSPSTPRSKPAAMAQADPSSSFDPTMYSSPRREPEPHRFNAPGGTPLRRYQPLSLPSPLPADAEQAPGSIQAELYRPTSTIDTISILSICATRPEFVPRAHRIFQQILEKVESGAQSSPEAKVWAVVIKAMEKLGTPEDESKQAVHAAALWRHRARELVKKWELVQAKDNTPTSPSLERNGIVIYRAWFSGMVEAETSFEPIVDVLTDPEVGVPMLVEGMKASLIPRALERLEQFATEYGRPEIIQGIDQVRNVEKDKEDILTREREAVDVAEVRSIMETKPPAQRALSAVRVEDSSFEFAPQARWVIRNLRDTLENINTPLSAYNRQMELERASYRAAEAELEHAAQMMEEAGLNQVMEAQRLKRNVLQGHMHRWHEALTNFLEKDIAELRKTLKTNDAEVGPPRWTASASLKDSTLLLYLSVLPPKRLALITVLELMRMVGSGGITDGMKALRGLLAVGKAVETEHRADTIRNVAGPGSYQWQRALDPMDHKPNRSQISQIWATVGREREERLKQEAGEPVKASDSATDLSDVWTPPWTQMVQMSVGSYLVNALMQVAKVTRYGKDPLTGETVSEEQAAFSHSYEYNRGKKLGVIRVNPEVAKRLASDSVRQVIHPKHLPMLVPPRPWTAWNDGAYLTVPVQAMRFKESIEQVNYLREASRNDHLSPVFHGLDVLSSTPWRINRQVFDVVLQAWNDGDAIADIPASSEKSEYNYPEKPDPRNSDPVARMEYLERMKAATLRERKDHGERCKYNYNLEIARSYLNDTFYIPHNMDFRGRAYPIPPHLSPVGDDLCRGLLTFGAKKPLGSTGLKWLQIHLANVYGYDKASFEERAQFAVEHEADIFDSADNPLNGKRWWLQAEDPWQCLATCFELSAALRSPDPTQFESCLPVHQDGTCNGMQHYAALGGDVRGAKAVNLEKGDRPADIYSGVADLVNASIAEDQKNNVPASLSIQLPLGRKVVKQTVMTTVYGVTFIGAREQIGKQLTARGDMAPEDIYVASTYVAKKVLASIGDLFAGAKSIQDWLTFSARTIARSIPPERLEEATSDAEPAKKLGRSSKKKGSKSRIAKELMTSVVWTSPLGLPVVQPYRKDVKKQVMTSLQTVYISDPNSPAQVSPQKQASAFPPNYIHSLDATHMLLTATQCNQNDITFASVHDSYWTHASTVEAMSETIRDTFIHLHSQDLVGELRAEFLQRYGEHSIPIVKGSNLLSEVSSRATKKSKAETEAGAEAEATTTTRKSKRTKKADAEAGSEVPEVELEEEGLALDEVSDVVGDISSKTFTVAGQAFIKIKDLLPPTPPRGQFDVERIRDSKYFFS